MILPQFIGAYQVEDIAVCDRLIEYHTQRKHMSFPTHTKDIKDSVDVAIQKDDLSDYFTQLSGCTKQYLTDYPKAGGNSRWAITESVGIQWYPVGGGYKAWHCERQSGYGRLGARHLVFMTYLNDVPDGGTEFYHQNWTCEAKKGLTLIWPAEWTFTHRGQISHTQEKYVVTGWFSFIG